MSETGGEEARPQSRTSRPDATPWPCRPALGPLRLCPRLGSPTSPSHRLPLALSFTALSWCPEVTSTASSHSCPWGPSPAAVGDPLPVQVPTARAAGTHRLTSAVCGKVTSRTGGGQAVAAEASGWGGGTIRGRPLAQPPGFPQQVPSLHWTQFLHLCPVYTESCGFPT